jgi:hypothetical protein
MVAQQEPAVQPEHGCAGKNTRRSPAKLAAAGINIRDVQILYYTSSE